MHKNNDDDNSGNNNGENNGDYNDNTLVAEVLKPSGPAWSLNICI
jgi:hypothetical protein